ncbi:hypothetical protein [Salibacterium sp. K-3]
MKRGFVQAGFFLLLVVFGWFSFFIIFGTAFTGDFHVGVFLFTGILSMIWTSSYLSMSLFDFTWKRAKDFLLLLTGISIIWGVLLSSLFLTPLDEAPWIFIGTPLLMLILWFLLLYRGRQRWKSSHFTKGTALLIVSIVYVFLVCRFYVIHVL